MRSTLSRDDMQDRDDNTLLASSQQGSLLAMRQLVRQYQDELLRTAYLLTGDREDVFRLVSTTFLQFFQALPDSNSDQDGRLWLLKLLGQMFVAGETAARPIPDIPPEIRSPSGTAHLQHFNVDDESTRVKAIIFRLDRQTRTALVLTEFNSLDTNVVAGFTDQTLEDHRSELERAKDQVAEVTGRPDRKLRGPLSPVAIAAPQVDLWPYLEEPLERIEADHQRRRRLLSGGAVAVVGLVLIAGLAWLFATDAFGERQTDPSASGSVITATVANTVGPQPAAESGEVATPSPSLPFMTGEIPELQLITNTRFFDVENVYSSVSSLRVTDQSSTSPIYLENAERPFGVSPDGRWALFIGTTWNEEYPQGLTKLTTFDTRNNEIAWEKNYFDSNPDSVAVTLEQAYVGSFAGELQAYNLWTGTKTGAWQLADPVAEDIEVGREGEPPDEHLIRLYVAPNQRRLYAYFVTDGSQTEPPTRTLRSYLLPGMTLVSSQSKTMEPSSDNWWIFDFSIWDALPTADGSSFYALMMTEANDFAIRFLDLSNNAVEEILLPFYSEDGRLRPHLVPSNSGTWLYVISGDGQRVAIINLLDRRLERVSPIDNSLVGQAVTSENLYDQQGRNGPWFSALTLDGERLYLAMPSSYDSPMANTTILTIEVQTWRITDRWNFEGRVMQMVVSTDGERLEMHLNYPDSLIDRGVVESKVATVDREGRLIGERPVAAYLPIAEPIGIVNLHSLSKTYQRRFGYAPVVGGIRPEDARFESTLPDLEIAAARPTIAGGAQVDITVRFLDPVSGEPLTGPRSDIRGDPDTALTIALSNEEADPVILQPVQMDDGVYRALATLETPGRWAATVNAEDDNGETWSVHINQLVDVIRSFNADDGKRYYPKFITSPEPPITGELLTVGIEFRDIENNLPMPEDVDLVGGLPEEIRVTFVARDLSYANKTVDQVGHGRYEGERGFRDAAKRELSFQFKLGDEQVSMEAGSIVVNTPPDEE